MSSIHLPMYLHVFLTTLAATVGFGAPVNDNFADRIVLSGVPIVAAGTTVDGTLEEGEPPALEILSTVWYEWTAPASGNLRARITDSSNTMVATVHSGTVLTGLEWVGGLTSSSEANLNVQPGITYQFRIAPGQPWPFPRLDGPFQLRLEYNSVPANDHFTNRIRLSNAIERISFRNVLASLELGESPVASAGGGYSVWYEWRAPASGVAHLLVDSSYGTVVGVYGGTPTNRGMMITNNVMEGGHARGEVIFAAIAEQVYHLVVDNTGTAVPGDGALTLTLNGAVRLSWPVRRPDGNVEVTVFGERYRNYALETSTNLTHWTAVSTNIYYNALVLEHDAALSSPMRFYRVRLVDP